MSTVKFKSLKVYLLIKCTLPQKSQREKSE